MIITDIKIAWLDGVRKSIMAVEPPQPCHRCGAVLDNPAYLFLVRNLKGKDYLRVLLCKSCKQKYRGSKKHLKIRKSILLKTERYEILSYRLIYLVDSATYERTPAEKTFPLPALATRTEV